MNNQLLNLVEFFLNMSMAFDKVWHEGLIFKLKSMGICDALLDLIGNFFGKQISKSCFKWSDFKMVTS